MTFCYAYWVIYKPKTVEESTLFLLQKGSLRTTELLGKIQELRPGTTKQGFYLALRKLKGEETIVLYGKRVSLSHIWIGRMSDYFARAKRAYEVTEIPSEDFLQLADGEKISYSFKTPAHTDMFWGHAFGILADITKKEEPICLYNPHEWFMLARHESERILFDEIKEKGKQLFLISGNRDPLDRFITTEFDENLSQYYMSEKPLFEKNNYYLNIFGDFLVEVWLDPHVSNEIDKFYKETTSFDEAAKEKIKKIVEGKGKNKFVISRNHRKAEKLKRIFKKYFLIKN